MARLGDYTDIRTGKLDANAASENGEYPFFTCSRMPLKINSYSYDCECVLIAGNGDLNAKYYNGKFDAYQRTYIVESKDKDILDVKYLYLFLDGYIDVLRDQSIGGVIKYIKLGNLTEAQIPIPPRSKQKHIVDVLDKVTDLITQSKRQLELMDELVKARFVEMFGDPSTNPNGYDICKLKELANKISDGVHAKPTYTTDGKPFISVVNINNGVIDFSNCKYVSEEAYQKMIKSTFPEFGDILYTKVGATYGIPAYVNTHRPFCLYVSVSLIKPKHDKINSRFLSLSMAMPYVKRQADERIRGIGVPDLHLNQIKEFEILCPPRKEQNQYVLFVEQIDKSKSQMQKSLDQLETLKKALMQQYFG